MIVGSGCMQQMCTQEEAAFAVNVDTGQTHALILSKSTISIYGGTPARRIKDIGADMKEVIARTARNYPMYATWYDQ